MIWLQADPGLLQFMPLIIIAGLFWFLILRPQQQEQNTRQTMQNALAKGDKVVTSGGIHGTVAGVEEHIVTVEIANIKGDRVRMKIDRGKIERRLDGSEASA